MKNEKNLTGITVVAVLHIALAALLISNSKISIFRTQETAVDIIPDRSLPPPKVDYVELPMEAMRQPTIIVPPLPDNVPQQQSNVTTKVQTDTLLPPATGPATRTETGSGERVVPAKAPVHVAAVVDSSNCAKPDYPKSALRNGDTGTVTLALLIGTDGRVAESKVEKSSGFRDLDRAAQTGLGLCKFKPGTIDGVPQQSWTRMQYVWNMDD